MNKHYLFNLAWLLLDQGVRVVSGIFVGIYVARYLGPTDFGVLSYVLAITALIIAVGKLGMDAIVVRETVKKHSDRKRIVSTAFWLMLTAGIVVYITTNLLSLKLHTSLITAIYVSIITISVIFTPFLAIEYYYQSQLKSKISTACRSASLITSSLMKLYLVWMKSDLIYFVIVSLLDHVLMAALLTLSLKHPLKIQNTLCFDPVIARNMLRSSWPLVLSALAVTIYMKIDQVMINAILGPREVGIYSAAVKIYEAWILIPYTFSISILPLLVKAKNNNSQESYEHTLKQIFSIVMWVNILVAAVVTFSGETIIRYSFGAQYMESHSVLTICIWSAFFASIGSVSARYFSVEHLEKKLALRTSAACFLNILLNLILIPRLGIEGAAFATLICTVFSNYIMDWIDPSLKKLLQIKHMALINPKILLKK
jgi:O-antigen/teichoic acid export membrane protein